MQIYIQTNRNNPYISIKAFMAEILCCSSLFDTAHMYFLEQPCSISLIVFCFRLYNSHLFLTGMMNLLLNISEGCDRLVEHL